MKLVNLKNNVNGYNSGGNWYLKDSFYQTPDTEVNDVFSYISGDSSGNITWAVAAYDYSPVLGNTYLYRINERGTLLKTKVAPQGSWNIRKVFTAPNGDIYIFSNNPSTYSSFNIVKLNSSLEIQWSKLIPLGVSGAALTMYCYGISTNPAGTKLYVCVSVYTYDGTIQDRGFVILNTSNGSVLQPYRLSNSPFSQNFQIEYSSQNAITTSSSEFYLLTGYVNGTSNSGGRVMRIPYSDETLVDWTSTKSLPFSLSRRIIPVSSNVYNNELTVGWTYYDSTFGIYLDKINTSTGQVVAGSYVNMQTLMSKVKFVFDSTGNTYIVGFLFSDLDLTYYIYVIKVSPSMVVTPLMRVDLPANWSPKKLVGANIIKDKLYLSTMTVNNPSEPNNFGNRLFSFDLANLPSEGQFGEVQIKRSFALPYTLVGTQYSSTYNGDPSGLSNEYTSGNLNVNLNYDSITENQTLREFTT